MTINTFLKKAGIYVAIGFVFCAIIALFIFRIISRRIDTGGSSVIDQHIDGIQSRIAEADELNKSIQDSTAEIRDSNNEIGERLEEASGSIDRLTEASNQLAELVSRLQKRAREENT